MPPAIRKLLAIALFSVLFICSRAQPYTNLTGKKDTKPYKVLTSGKQITIKSTKDIKHVMLWTTGGNRVVEQKEINAGSYTFTIPVSQKTFFLMIGLSDGKIYTEKIGLRE
jgi:hypothetical protein